MGRTVPGGLKMHAAFPVLATGWAMLWVLPSFVLGTSHPPAQGLAWPVILLASGWMLGWLRSGAITTIWMNRDGRWFLAALGLAPVLIFAAVPFVEARLWHSHYGLRADFELQMMNAAFFCLPWLVLLFGTGAMIRTVELPPDATHRGPLSDVAQQIAGPCRSEAVLVPSEKGTLSVPVANILWLKSEQNYVRIYTEAREYFLRSSLSDLLAKFGEHRFVRIHKSRAVNIAEVAAIETLPKGDAEVVLRAGQRLRMSRRFRDDLLGLWPH